MKSSRIAAAVIGGVGAWALSGAASAQIAGDAGDYNVFVFGSGSFTSQNTDTMGNLAAGGNVSLINYSVAAGINGSNANPNPARLVVGGTLTAQNGGVGANQAGSIYTNSTPSLTTFTATGGVHAQTLISSFSADQTQYTSLSNSLAALTANGITSGLLAGNTLDLTGTSHGLNVFDVSASTLSNSQTINISAPTGSTVLIDVSGSTTVNFQNGSVNETGVSAASVLYNIASSSVDLVGSKDPKGSILAPNAGVTGGYGSMTGQLITDSYSGNTQFDATLFTGNLTPVPVPAAVWLLLGGLGGIGSFIRRGLR